MMTNKTFSIYVHFPFCISKCAYCAFYSESFNDVIADQYTNAVIKTLDYISTITNNTVETIYFGGGTPTSIGATRLCKILNHIKSRFRLIDNCEITVEANPKTVNEDDASKLLECGFNRVSLGIQTTSSQSLKTLGRIHSWDDSVKAYNTFKSVGFSNISVDLMYALPNTSTNDTILDLKKILELNPQHISTYALSLEEGTPLFNSKNSFSFPSDEDQLDTYLSICNELSQNRYDHYEISNFAKPNFYSKHNMGYWSLRDYIGIGASAHSLWDNKRFSSPSNRELFISYALHNDFTAALGMNDCQIISKDDKAEEEIMLSLRTSSGIKLTSLSQTLKRFVDEGFATYNNNVFSLTDKGFFVSNTIIYYVCKELIYDKQ